MKRKLTIAAAVLVVLGVVVGLAALFGPQFVSEEIEGQLKATLDARGIDATWGNFVAHGGRSFEIEDVRVEAPHYGLSFRSDRVLVRVSVGSVWRGDVTLSEVEVEPAHVEIDVEPLLEREAGEGGGTGGGRMESLVQRLLKDPPAVRLVDARVLVRRGEQELLRVDSPLVSVEESWGEFEVAFEGNAELLAAGLPAVLREEIPWKVRGTVSGGEFEYRVTSPLEGEALVRVELPDVMIAEVGSVFGKGTVTDQTAALNADGLELVLVPGEVAALHAKAPRASVSRQANGRPRIDVEKPSVYAAPGKRGEILRALRSVRGPSAGDGGGSGESQFSRLMKVAARTDVVLEGLAVGVHLEDDAGDLQTLTLLERLDTTIRDGRIRVDGSTAGGRFHAEAEVLPGQRWPHFLVVRAEGVRLEKIPGLSRERTALPSRGTSGRVGGRLDVDLALTMPPQGMEGPLTQAPGVGEFSFRLEDGRLDLTGVSNEPVEGIDASASFAFTFEPQLARIDVVKGLASYGPMNVEMTGAVTDFPLDTEVSLRFEMEKIDCQEAVRSLPDALLGPYAEVELEGTFAPSGRFKLPIHRPKGMRARFDFEPVEDRYGNRIVKKRKEDDPHCTMKGLHADEEAWPEIKVVDWPPTGPHASVTEIPNRPLRRHDDVWWLNRPFVKRIEEGLSDLEEVEVYVGPGTEHYIPIEQLPKYVPAVMYLSEQIDFYEDGPVSFSLMKKAMRLNLSKGRFVYGGSTVTQQLVKNLFLSREKTLARKVQEALVSWRVDEVISKDRVLELYLNCIEFGPDVYGIGRAARYYFQKDARKLTPKEGIFLAMLKPAPWQGKKIVDRGRTPSHPYWTERVEILFDRLIEHGFVTRAEAEAAKPWSLEWSDSGRYQDPNVAYVPLLD